MHFRSSARLRQAVAATALAALANLVAPAAALAQNAYITNNCSGTVSVIDTGTNHYVYSPINVGSRPSRVAVTPDGSRVYVTNTSSGTVSVIDTATSVVATIPVGSGARGVAVTPDGSKVYVANAINNNVSVIDTATNAVVATLPVGNTPMAFGLFIQPAKPLFAGNVGQANCAGESVAAVTRRHGGMRGAARALDYASVADLQAAIGKFCNA